LPSEQISNRLPIKTNVTSYYSVYGAFGEESPNVTSGLVLSLYASNISSYPGSGTTWTDLSGNSNNGTLINGPTYGSVPTGTIIFDGSNDYVDTPIISLSTSGSISVWIYKTGNGNPDAANVVDFFSNVSLDGTKGWAVGINVNTSKVDFYIANLTGYGVEDYSITLINQNTWYNVTCTYNGTSKIIYINGVQDSIFASTVNGANTAKTWGIGSRSVNSRCFKGYIPIAQMYNRALTAPEVLQNYNARKTRFGL